MQTTQQLIADLDALQNGECWVGYNANEIIETIDEKIACIRAYVGGNSIWQLLNHISYWRNIVTQRIIRKQHFETDKEGFDEPVGKNSAEWMETKSNFQNSYLELRSAISTLTSNDLEKSIDEGQTLYFNIHGCLLHDAFHLGQVLLIKRMAEHHK